MTVLLEDVLNPLSAGDVYIRPEVVVLFVPLLTSSI